MAETLYKLVTGCTNVENVQVDTSHSSQVSTAIVTTKDTTLDIGDFVEITVGYVGNTNKIFSGYVKQKEYAESNTGRLYTLTCSDVLIRAQDFFIASSNPNSPFTRSNIAAEDLVEDVLALAMLTDYTSEATNFTFAVYNPLTVNLTSSYDYCRFISDILAWHLYADENGTVHFVDRRAYLMGGDSPEFTIPTTDVLDIKRTVTDRNLRNRVVVYGNGDIHATAQASSPYLPDGFYKSVVVSAPSVFDTQSMAQSAANRNLTILNRLTQSVNATVIGNPNLLARKIVTLNRSSIDISGNWYVFSAAHALGRAGYTTTIELRK